MVFLSSWGYLTFGNVFRLGSGSMDFLFHHFIEQLVIKVIIKHSAKFS